MGDSIVIQNHISSLIDKVHSISLRYQGLGNQNNFNIFTVLRNPHEEVNLHSAFLCELLNPNGGHGLTNGVFLQDFIRELQSITPVLAGIKKDENEEDQLSQSIDKWTTDDMANTEVISEWPFTTTDCSGRIDILIKSRYQAIIIENKIYAEDQDRQLERYYHYSRQKNIELPENTTICYLTLFGSIPEKKTTGESQIPVICISYRENIQRWLDECIKHSAQHPTLRETLVQYKKLLKKLTGDTMEDQEKQEIFKAISCSKDSVLSAHKILKTFPDLVADNIELFWNDIERYTIDICKEFGISAKVLPFQNKPSSGELKKNATKKIGKKNFCILFQLFPVYSPDKEYYFCLLIQGLEEAKKGQLNDERVTVDFTIVDCSNRGKISRQVNKDEQLTEFRYKMHKAFPDDKEIYSDYYLLRRFVKAIVSPAKYNKEEVALLIDESYRNDVIKTVMDSVRKLFEDAKPHLDLLKAGN